MFRVIFLMIGLISTFSAAASFIPSEGSSTISELKRDLMEGAGIANLHGGFGANSPQQPTPSDGAANLADEAEPTGEALPTTGICMVTTSGQHIPVTDYTVTDGDTIRVWNDASDDYIVRLLGIDAPEKAQRHGIDSQDNLEGLLQQGREVSIIVHTLDKYDRMLADVCVDGNSVNVQQVAEGMAYTYLTSHVPDLAFKSRLEYAMRQAKRDGLGVHGCTDCIAPHEYRKLNRR